MRFGEGFIEGREQIVSCISHRFHWSLKQRPEILLFNLDGRPIDRDINAFQTEYGWAVNLELDGWQKNTIIAQSP